MPSSAPHSTPNKAPAFQFYAKDFDTGTRALSAEEVGVYIRLLCHQWDKGFIPIDLELSSRIGGVSLARMRHVWKHLQEYFILNPDDDTRTQFINLRLERERLKQAEHRQRQSDKGRASAASRKSTDTQPETNRGSTTVQPETEPKVNSPISSLQSAVCRARENARAEETDLAKRAGAFCEWYEDAHQRIFGVGYIGTQRDYQAALQLCEKLSDQEVRDATLVWFGQDDDFATRGTRTIPKFASRASGCLQLAREAGIA